MRATTTSKQTGYAIARQAQYNKIEYMSSPNWSTWDTNPANAYIVTLDPAAWDTRGLRAAGEYWVRVDVTHTIDVDVSYYTGHI